MNETALLDNLEKVCKEAYQKFEEINQPEFEELKSKLAWCLGSYSYDKNPTGLFEVGKLAFDTLKAYKEANPKAVTKKLIDDMGKVFAPAQEAKPQKEVAEKPAKAAEPKAPKAAAKTAAAPKAAGEAKPKAAPKAAAKKASK